MGPTRTKRGALAEMQHVYRMLSMRAREIWLLVGLAVLFAVFEGIGVGMLAPVLQYIEYGHKALDSKSTIWKYLLKGAELVHLPINLGTLLILAFIPVILRMVVYFVNSWYSAEVAQRAATRLRSKGFDTLVHSDLAFVVREGLGNLVSALTAQVMRGSQAMQQFIQQISTGLLITMYIVVLLILSAPLTGITIVAMIFISWVISGNIARSRRLGREAADRNDETFTVVSERISAIRLIKMLGQERAETGLITDVVRRLEEVQVRIAISRGIVQVTVEPALMLALFVVIFVGVTVFHTPLATIGLFMFILLRLNDKATTFNGGRQNLSANIDSLEAVHDLIDRAATARTIHGGTRKFEHLESGISFRGVSFTYEDGDESEPVLRDIEITIPKGTQIALVGRSGAGKSTLADLVPHLREATHGEVLIDGVPIGDYDLVSLRRGIGFMTQEALLFNDTIYNNLVYGLERVPTSEEVEEALRKAFCTEFVAELPEGLETNVGDRGVRLSGGQRQRLSLARVFLEDPDIFILDEPTSALDSESEEYIQKALQSVHGTKTLIVIAHRLSTIQRSDEILVLDKGCILERGTHQELLDLEGSYRRLFELQIYQ